MVAKTLVTGAAACAARGLTLRLLLVAAHPVLSCRSQAGPGPRRGSEKHHVHRRAIAGGLVGTPADLSRTTVSAATAGGEHADALWA